jgi:hypothetical protein
VGLWARHDDELIYILELKDESFELGVLIIYIPEFKKLLATIFLKYLVN